MVSKCPHRRRGDQKSLQGSCWSRGSKEKWIIQLNEIGKRPGAQRIVPKHETTNELRRSF